MANASQQRAGDKPMMAIKMVILVVAFMVESFGESDGSRGSVREGIRRECMDTLGNH